MKRINLSRLARVISYLEVQKQRSLTQFGNRTPSRYSKGKQEGELDAYNTAILALQSLISDAEKEVKHGLHHHG